MKKRIMSLMLTLCMVFAMLPAAAAREKSAYTVASETVFNNIKKLPIDNYTTVEDMENALMALLPKDNNYRIIIEFNTHINATTTKKGQIDCTPYLYDPDKNEYNKLSFVMLTIPIAKEDPQEKVNIEADVAAIGEAFGKYCAAAKIDLESFRSSVEKSALLEAAQGVKNKFTKVSWREFSVSSPKDGKDGYMKGTLKVVLGAETRTVEFKAAVHSNGTVTMNSPAVPTFTATPTNDKLTVNGVLQTPTVYKIGGSNYFKLRDLAVLLNGTGCQFNVGYDAATKSATAEKGQGYTKLDSDMQGPASSNQTAIISNDKILIDGKAANVEVYKINGGNYFKLRDLGNALGFDVGWDDTNKVASISTK